MILLLGRRKGKNKWYSESHSKLTCDTDNLIAVSLCEELKCILWLFILGSFVPKPPLLTDTGLWACVFYFFPTRNS